MVLFNDVTDLLEVSQDAAMDDLLLERVVEAFGDAVGLGLGNKGEAGGHTPEPDLVEEVVRGVLGVVVHAQGQAAPGLGAGSREFRLEPLGDRLQGRETIADLHRMDTHAAGVEMIHRREHPDPALLHRLDTQAVSAPHLVRVIRGDGPRVQTGAPLEADDEAR